MNMLDSGALVNTDIVIVDDDEHNLKVLTELLNAAGYTVRPANSGALALRSIQAKPPALILLDIQMPGMDGYEVCRRLKADARTGTVPIIFISVPDQPHDKAKGFRMGGVDFITKPFEEPEVLARVQTHLALRRMQAELERHAAELAAANTQLHAEINDRKQAEHDLRLNEARLAALLQLYQLTDSSIAHIADFAMEQGIQLTDSMMGFLIFLTPDETIGTVHSWSKMTMAACAIVDKPLQFVIAETGLWGEVVRQRQPILINDFAAPHPAKRGFPNGHVPISRYLSIPVFEENRIVAVAAVANKQAAYNDTDVRQLQLFMQGMWGILQRKRAEDSLADALQRLTAHIDNSPLAMIEFDPQFRVTRWSKEAERVFGWTAEEIVGRSVTDMRWVYEGDADLVRQESAGLFSGERPRSLNVNRNYTKDGAVIYCEWYDSAIYDTQGKLVSILSQVLDITERKQVEEALRESEERFRVFMNYVPGIVFLKDSEGRFLFANAYHHKLFAREPHDLIGQRVDTFWNADIAHRFMEQDQIVLSERRVLETEETYPDLEGLKHWLTCKFPIFRDGKPTLIGGISLDITDRKQAEEALRQAKDVAEEASRAKSQFLANLSHDLRTPLNSILSYAQFFRQQTNFTETQQHGLAIIQRSGEHLLAMINDLLDFSTIEAGKMRATIRPFCLWQLLDTVMESVRRQVEIKGIALICDYAPDLPVSVCGDDLHLHQILLNLLSNAIKFTEQGTITLRVGVGSPRPVAHEETSPLPIRFEVEDTGIGIPADQLDAIFEPFHQVTEGLSKPKGIGLGLPISLQLSRLMQSDIYVRSVVGQGSVFWFDLALPVVDTGQPALSAAEIETLVIPAFMPTPESERIEPPPLEDVAALYELARIGNIMGLRNRLARLEASDPRWQPFVKKLKGLARDIKLQEILVYLHQYLQEETQ